MSISRAKGLTEVYEIIIEFTVLSSLPRTFKRNIETRSRNHCCRGKAISITYSECVSVALVIQHTLRMRHIVMWPAPLYSIFHVISKQRDFLKKKILNTKCVFWSSLQLSSETFLVLRTERDMTKNVRLSSCKVPLILVRFKWNSNFLERFSNKSSDIKFHGNPSSGSRVVPCGWTGGKKWRS